LGDWLESAIRRLIIRLFQNYGLVLPFLAASPGFIAIAAMISPESHQSRWIYFLFRLLCNQDPKRCFVLNGQPMPLCERCLALYLGFFFGGIVFVLLKARLRNWHLGILLLGWTPLIIDGLTQFLRWRESAALLRISTGALAGIISSIYVLQKIRRIMEEAVSTLRKLFSSDQSSSIANRKA
jgi:uncharacterized membrane protein